MDAAAVLAELIRCGKRSFYTDGSVEAINTPPNPRSEGISLDRYLDALRIAGCGDVQMFRTIAGATVNRIVAQSTSRTLRISGDGTTITSSVAWFHGPSDTPTTPDAPDMTSAFRMGGVSTDPVYSDVAVGPLPAQVFALTPQPSLIAGYEVVVSAEGPAYRAIDDNGQPARAGIFSPSIATGVFGSSVFLTKPVAVRLDGVARNGPHGSVNFVVNGGSGSNRSTTRVVGFCGGVTPIAAAWPWLMMQGARFEPAATGALLDGLISLHKAIFVAASAPVINGSDDTCVTIRFTPIPAIAVLRELSDSVCL